MGLLTLVLAMTLSGDVVKSREDCNKTYQTCVNKCWKTANKYEFDVECRYIKNCGKILEICYETVEKKT